MPIPLPWLDDRQFDDLIDELRSLIPRHAPDWTDHNASDPGIMLLELFAWLTEGMIFRLNRVSAASRARFMELLGAAFLPACPQRAHLLLVNTGNELFVPVGTALRSQQLHSGERIHWVTTHDLLVPAPSQESANHQSGGSGEVHVEIRQTTAVTGHPLGLSNGAPHQLFQVPPPYIVLDAAPEPEHPQLLVGDRYWSYVADSVALGGPESFTVDATTRTVILGEPGNRLSPVDPLPIQITYRYSRPDGGIGVARKERLGDLRAGAHSRHFRLIHRPFLGPVPDRYRSRPSVAVNLDGEETIWHYRPLLADGHADDHIFTIEPRLNAVRFGDGEHGRIPDHGAAINLTYSGTLGAIEPTAEDATIDFLDEPFSSQLTVIDWETTVKGMSPTTLEQARDQATELLRPGWRAVSGTDFEHLAVTALSKPRTIARARCFPDRRLIPGQEWRVARAAPGHVSVLVVPTAADSYQHPQPVDSEHLTVASGPTDWAHSSGVVHEPSQQELVYRELGELLNSRRLVTSRIHVVPPVFVNLRVRVGVVRVKTDQTVTAIKRDVQSTLAAFFDPLSGGPEGDGWPFGRAIYLSEVYQQVESVMGVDHVSFAEIWVGAEGEPLEQVQGSDRVEIPTNALIRYHPHRLAATPRAELALPLAAALPASDATPDALPESVEVETIRQIGAWTPPS